MYGSLVVFSCACAPPAVHDIVSILESSSNLVRGTDNVDDWVCSERSGVTVAVFAIIRMRVRWPEGVGAPLISDFAKIYWWYATVMSGLRFGGCMGDAVEKLGGFAGCVRLCMCRVVASEVTDTGSRFRSPKVLTSREHRLSQSNDEYIQGDHAMYDDSR